MTKTKFIRAGEFNNLELKAQHDMAKEMVKAWTQAKAAYVQTRMMFTWK